MSSALQSRRILITCGTGGVGKTTLSAALGLKAARLGRKVVVVTIDPAKRLAHSLGLKHLGDEPQCLDAHLREEIGELKVSFAAVMPDTRKTFETFIRALAPSEIFIERVLNNPIFQILSKEFSGAQEYMALQKLEALEASAQFDLVILDTPPSRNAVEFFETPRKVARVFEERIIRWLVLPTNKIISAGMRKVYESLERLTGAGFITHLIDFATLLSEIQVPFMNKVKRVSDLLSSKDLGFVLAAAPSVENLPDFEHLLVTLREKRFLLDAILLNRSLSAIPAPTQEDRAREPALELFAHLQERERTVIRSIESSPHLMSLKSENLVSSNTIQTIPQFNRDIHSLKDLIYVSEQILF